MKKLIIATAILLVGLQVEARGKIGINHNKAIDKTVISIINTNMQYDNLEVTDAQSGQVLLNKNINHKAGIVEVIDEASFGASTYKVTLENNEGTYTKEITMAGDNVINNEVNIEGDENDIMKFFLQDDNNTLLISHYNNDKNSLIMEITNMDNNKVTEVDYVGKRKAFSNKYDISGLKSGNYKVALYSGQTAYYYNFSL
ncbi:hypothetical protein E9993_11690 [Labilibacter sediminis]|nr:hypothetical protein E9993_11690 [Labilibacter sediminis]